MNLLKKLYITTQNGLWYKVKYHSEKAYAIWNNFWTTLVSGGWLFNDEDLIMLNKYCTKKQIIFWEPGECHYEQAVRINNISFCRAYEKFRGREPFVWNNIDYRYGWGQLPYGMHSTQAKIKGRLVIGAEFIWKNIKVKVTSFKDKEKSLVACAYTIIKEGAVCEKCGVCLSCNETKINRRFIITAKEMAETLKDEASKRKS